MFLLYSFNVLILTSLGISLSLPVSVCQRSPSYQNEPKDAARAAVDAGFVKELLKPCKLHAADATCVAAIFTALRAIACNDESVQQISAGGGLAMAEAQLSAHATDAGVCRSAAALLRNLAGNDQVGQPLNHGRAPISPSFLLVFTLRPRPPPHTSWHTSPSLSLSLCLSPFLI